MAKLTMVTGVEEVLKNLSGSRALLERRWPYALAKGGLLLQRMSQEIVPIDTGNLKAGAFTRSEGKGFGTDVSVGYVAHYAVYVHENLEARHKPGKEAKFLEKPMRENRDQILEVIQKAAQGKGLGND